MGAKRQREKLSSLVFVNLLFLKKFQEEWTFNALITLLCLIAYDCERKYGKRGSEKGEIFDLIRRVETAQDYGQSLKNKATRSIFSFVCPIAWPFGEGYSD